MKDALAIHHAHMESIQILCSRDYTTEEIKAWGHLKNGFEENGGSETIVINNQSIRCIPMIKSI